MSTETTSEGFSIRPKGCPSELELDQLHLGELSDADAVRVQAAVEDSEFARESLAKRETGFVFFPEVNAEKMVAEIYRQTSAVDFSLDVDDGSLLERFFKKWFGSGI
ncbi:MAG TPA: hypothetical protein QF772_07660, partial [Nitrospinaceae bacterium]|nr:hypothetical protein [Nitrospinaceae bacterium]